MANKEGNKEGNNVSMLMHKVFGDRLNGLSEAEIAYVQEQMIANLDKVKTEAKERAAWAPLNEDIIAVFEKHNKLSVLLNKGNYRFGVEKNADGKAVISSFALYAKRKAGANTNGMIKQYRKAGAKIWEVCPGGTWAGACNKHRLPTNGASGKVALESNRFEVQVVKSVVESEVGS